MVLSTKPNISAGAWDRVPSVTLLVSLTETGTSVVIGGIWSLPTRRSTSGGLMDPLSFGLTPLLSGVSLVVTGVNDLVMGREFNTDDEDGSDDEDLLIGCQPGIIYFFRLQVYYDHEVGKMEEKLFLSTSFEVTSDNWSEFVRDYFDLSTAEKRTQPWDLLRMSPSAVGQSTSGQYFQKIMLTQEFIANYERNCCTFVGSVLPIYDAVKCDFADFDSDFDSDDIGYPTYWFCDYLLGTYDTADFETNCGDSDDDECATMTVETDTRRQFIAGDKLRRVMYGARSSGPVEKITRGDYKKKIRGTYDYTEQPIPGFGGVYDGNTDSYNSDFWNPYWDDAVFYYVPYTSSITAPYCGYKASYR